MKPTADTLSEADLDRLQALLDALPAPLEPLDVSMVDGYLCGVLLQPEAVPLAAWLPPLLDAEGRPTPARVDDELMALLRRRHKELNVAIAGRQWFDPWIFELDDEAEPSETLLPWVAGFAHALDAHPALMRLPEEPLLEPLAAIYLHLDPDDLEDADALLEEIESLEPPADLEEAVEGLVSAVLMLADVSRPLRAPPGRAQGGRARPDGTGRGGVSEAPQTGAGRAGPGRSRPKQTGRR
ncbi:YecA family protein [Roseateles sp. LKC17W]|uniref:YecA family protein n=1 Tax=Pelomonas margarita TaxID=3299031 RepID=A0ABW7FLY2_9BURK